MSTTSATALTRSLAKVVFEIRKNAGTLTDAGLRPSSLKSYRPNDFVLRNGFPYAPPLWMHAATLVSSTGEYLSGDREDAFDVDIPAHTRFIASDSTWDDVAFRWDPALTSGIDYAFEGAPGSSPVLDEVTYRIGKEVITKPAFYFTPGTFLASSFNSGIDDAVQFTITLALALETPGPYAIFAAPPDAPATTLSTDATTLSFAWNNAVGTLKPKRPVSQLTPLYLAFVVSNYSVALHLATAPTQVTSYAVPAKSPTATPMSFTLGADHNGGTNATMYLMEFGLWDYALTTKSDTTIYELFAAYSSIYGAHSG